MWLLVYGRLRNKMDKSGRRDASGRYVGGEVRINARVPPPTEGAKFGNWSVLSAELDYSSRQPKVLVACAHVTKWVHYQNLLRGISKGCVKCKPPLNKERRYIRNRWISIKARCFDPTHKNYHNYGGRGITLHDSFLEFDAFYTYLKSLPGFSISLSIDRINNDGNYEPGNLRFATAKQQNTNRRDVTVVEWQGMRLSLKEFIRSYTQLSCSYGARLFKQGYTLEQLCTYFERR